MFNTTKMKNKKVFYIILITILLVVFLWIQYFWISYAINVSESNFINTSTKVLNESVSEFEESFYCVNFYSEFDVNESENIFVAKNDSLKSDSIRLFYYDIFDNDSLKYSSYIDFSFPAKIQVEINAQYQFDKAENASLSDYIKNNIGYFFTDTSSFNTFLFDSILNIHLVKYNINQEYYFAITDTDSVIYISNNGNKDYLLNSEIFSELTVKGIKTKSFKVYLFFPNKLTYVYSRLSIIILSTIGVLIILFIILLIFIRNLNNDRKLLEMKTGFISNMTHEFQTPISNINLALDTIRKRDKNETSNSSILNIIREENNRMKDNINKILQISVMEKDKISYNKEQININELISKVIESLEVEFYNSKNNIILDKDNNIEYLFADEVHITNIFFNLIDNAIKYSDSSREIEINISVKLKKDWVQISISDNGIGISESNQKRVFDKFFRVQDGYLHDVKGFGLGLSYVKSVVEAHNGKITLKSELGKGSTFNIFIPNKQ